MHREGRALRRLVKAAGGTHPGAAGGTPERSGHYAVPEAHRYRGRDIRGHSLVSFESARRDTRIQVVPRGVQALVLTAGRGLFASAGGTSTSNLGGERHGKQPDPHLRHDAQGRRADPRREPEPVGKARNRAPARASRRRHHRGGVPGGVAGRFRGGARGVEERRLLGRGAGALRAGGHRKGLGTRCASARSRAYTCSWRPAKST